MFLRSFKQFWRLNFGRGSFVLPCSNGKRLRDIQHNINIVLASRFHIRFIITVLLQILTDIIKKMRQILLENAVAILL